MGLRAVLFDIDDTLFSTTQSEPVEVTVEG